MKLFINALTKFTFGFLIVATLIFLPAGTLHFSDGWVFLGLLFVPIFILGAVLLIKAPKLLKKRLENKEKETVQKGVVALSALIFLLGFVAAGLDFRFALSTVPHVLKIIAAVIFLLSYVLYAEVMRENAYLSRTVKVEENQTLVSTGLYSFIRHPMYAATVLMFLSIPLILGSFVSFFIFIFYPAIIIVRIKNEEKVLSEQLIGYEEYKKRVKYRIVPFVW
ncbi:MAG: isoprenylcysteine carboxylmethyltransferase family protein [Acutalibacteraceae bacterium]|nr:isoprenylcysteine carboxylmethyltransferase family protein [Acutalibacteraceae bacterium]